MAVTCKPHAQGRRPGLYGQFHTNFFCCLEPQSAFEPAQATARCRLACALQVYNPYGRPYTLPIPTTLQPSAVKTAPNVSYPDASTGGGLMALANASTNFGLRFSGEDLGECT